MKSQCKWHRLFLSSLIATTITTSLFDTNSYRATANSQQKLSNPQGLSQFQTIGLKKSSSLSTLVKPNVHRFSSKKTLISAGERSPDGGERSPLVTGWIRQFGTTGDDSSRKVAIDKAGNVYVAGNTSGSLGGANAGNYDAFVTKYDNRGNRLWIKQWGTSAFDGANDLAVDNAGNVYVTGPTNASLLTSRSISSATSQYTFSNPVVFVTKYDTNGNQLWTKQLGTAATFPCNLALDSSGNVYISGNTTNSLGGKNAGVIDAFVAKFDTSGTQLWVQQLGTSAEDNSIAIRVDSTGNVYIGGYTDGLLGNTSFGGRDAYIAKYNTNGTRLWIQQLGTSADDLIYGLALDSNGNIYITGNTTGPLGGTNAGGSDVFIAKYNSSGTRLWTKQLGTTTNDYSSNDIAVDNAGNAYISGFTQGSLGGTNAGSYDAWIGKYDSNGQLLWTQQLGTAADDKAYGIVVQGNDIYVTGETAGALGAANAGSYDAWLGKFSF